MNITDERPSLPLSKTVFGIMIMACVLQYKIIRFQPECVVLSVFPLFRRKYRNYTDFRLFCILPYNCCTVFSKGLTVSGVKRVKFDNPNLEELNGNHKLDQ